MLGYESSVLLLRFAEDHRREEGDEEEGYGHGEDVDSAHSRKAEGRP